MYLLISGIFRIYEIIIIIRVIFSWIPTDRNKPFARWIYALTEPLLEPIRRILPLEKMGIDISPLLLLFAMSLIQQMLLKLFFSF